MNNPQAARKNFMNSTGFGGKKGIPRQTSLTPTPTSNHASSEASFKSFHDISGPKPPARAPGQLIGGGNPYPNSLETPLNGLVPGHLPPNRSLDRSRKIDPYPSSTRYGKTPFVGRERGKRTDWNAVGVGPETKRRSPGQVAKTPLNQGKWQDIKEKVSGSMTGSGSSQVYKTVMYFFACASLVTAFLGIRSYTQRRHTDTTMGGLAILFAIIASSVYMYKGKEFEKAIQTKDMMRDTSKNQKYKPNKRHSKDPSPYPRMLDRPMTTMQKMKSQGIDMNNVEGPRNDYGYKRGPTPGNQKRLQADELMRDPALYNMDKAAFNEYMASLEGENINQLYQRYPYHPLAAHAEHRNQIDDSSTIYGISDQPAQMMRKNKYIDPRMQQPGAKTSHLKDPPPGSAEPLDKVHPWMEKQDGEGHSAAPMDMMPMNTSMTGIGPPQGSTDDAYMEQLTAGPEMNNNFDKLTAADAGRLATDRNSEEEYYRQKYGGSSSKPKDLPAGLKPIPTTREGITKAREDEQRKLMKEKHHRQNQQIQPVQNYDENVRKLVPPQYQQSKTPDPRTYGNSGGTYEREMAETRRPTSGNSMGAPPTESMTAEEDADALFTASFGVKKQPNQENINAAIMDVRRS